MNEMDVLNVDSILGDRFDDWTSPEFWSWFRRNDKNRSSPIEETEYHRKQTSLKLNTKYADCDWHKSENTTDHHTADYDRTDNSMVVRRGQQIKGGWRYI